MSSENLINRRNNKAAGRPIRVIYREQAAGFEDYDSLEDLIKRDKISAFFTNKWISVENLNMEEK